VEKGIHLLEVANLDALSVAKTYDFLFVALPLKIVGATGSPVRPIAIV
jgi:kynurenine formamidase